MRQEQQSRHRSARPPLQVGGFICQRFLTFHYILAHNYRRGNVAGRGPVSLQDSPGLLDSAPGVHVGATPVSSPRTTSLLNYAQNC